LAYASLAWVWATCPEAQRRNGKQALEYADRAYKLSNLPWCLEVLAAAHAENGQFAEAVEQQKKALQSPDLTLKAREEAQQRLRLYEAGKPFRETSRTSSG
jgi:hypothetical protein